MFLLSPPHMAGLKGQMVTSHPPPAQYDHHRVGIKWDRVSYGVQSSDNSWWCCHSTAIFPLPTGKTIFIGLYSIWLPLCNWAAPHPSGSRGPPALSHQMYLWLSDTWEKALLRFFDALYILCITLFHIGLRWSHLILCPRLFFILLKANSW